MLFFQNRQKQRQNSVNRLTKQAMDTTRPNTKYLIPFAMGICGIIAIGSPLIGQIPSEMTNTANRIEQEKIRAEIEQREQTAKKLRQAKLVPLTNSLTIRDYLLSDKAPKLRKSDIIRYPANQQVFVYDASGLCIGKIHNKKFTTVHSVSDVCDQIPNIDVNPD